MSIKDREETPSSVKKAEQWDDYLPIQHPSTSQQEEQRSFSKAWTSNLIKIRKPISSVLLTIAGASARNPKKVIIFSIILALSILSIGLFTNFHIITDGDFLWTPTPSRVLTHGLWFDNDSGFPTPPRAAFFNIHADGENILTDAQDATKRMFTLIDTVRNTPGYDDSCKQAKVYMKDINGDTTCFIQSSIRFWNYTVDSFIDSVSSDEDVIEILSQTTYPDSTPVDPDSILGYPEIGDDGLLTFAQMLINIIYLPEDDETLDLETSIIDNILDLRKQWEEESDNRFKLEVRTQRSFDDEFERAIVADIPLVPLIFIVMSIFTCLIFFRRNWIYSRSMLGFGAVCTVLLSIMMGYGLLFTIGVPFTSMAQILPFVMFGIGLDDAFIIWGSYQRTDPLKESEERIHDTIEDVGVSIFVTTITSIIAFTLGSISSIPAVYWLCYYAAPTIAIDFILQITFFVALIVLDERRVKDGRRDFLFCLSAKESSESSKTTDDEPQPENYTENIFERFMRWLSHVLMIPAVKAVVVIGFLGMFGGFGYAATQLEQEFQFTDVLPNPSYVGDFWKTFAEYSLQSGVSPFVVFRDVDQSKSNIQEQMNQYVNDLVGMNTVSYQPNFFWLRDFDEYVNSTASLHNASFIDQLDSFLAVPTFSQLYNDEIVRDNDGNIIVSRTRLRMDNIDQENITSQTTALADALDVSESQPINEGREDWAFFTYDPLYYIWMFYTVTPGELLLSTLLGVSAVTFITLLFVPHWTSALFVAPIITMLYIDLLGFLQVCGIAINAVSYISLVMSIGLMVDFLLHILLRYYESKEATRTEKVKDVIQTMGTSVLIGGLSSFLGVVPLSFAASDIFSTIFVVFLGLVLFGCTHGLIFLPVLLSMFGPNAVLDFH